MPGSHTPNIMSTVCTRACHLAAAANGEYGLFLPFTCSLTDYEPELLLAGEFLKRSFLASSHPSPPPTKGESKRVRMTLIVNKQSHT